LGPPGRGRGKGRERKGERTRKGRGGDGREKEGREEGTGRVHYLRKTTPRHQVAGYGPDYTN